MWFLAGWSHSLLRLEGQNGSHLGNCLGRIDPSAASADRPGPVGDLYGLDIAPDGKLLAVGGVGPTRHDAWIYLVSLPVGQIVRAFSVDTRKP